MNTEITQYDGPTPSPKVLLIDDDDIFGLMMTRVATLSGVKLTHQRSARAVTPGVLRQFDLLIIDFELENITGPQLIRCFRAAQCTAPIALVSSYRGYTRSADSTLFLNKSLGPVDVLKGALELLNTRK